MNIRVNASNTSPVEAPLALPRESQPSKAAELCQLHSSLCEKHQFLKNLEKQGVPAADLKTLQDRTTQALRELEKIMAFVGETP